MPYESDTYSQLPCKFTATGAQLQGREYPQPIRNRVSGNQQLRDRGRKRIADMFREGGLIEKHGTGIRCILKAFRDYGLPEPKFEEIAGGFRVTAYSQAEGAETGEVTGEVRRLLPLCCEPTIWKELMGKLGLRHEGRFRDAVECLDSGSGAGMTTSEA